MLRDPEPRTEGTGPVDAGRIVNLLRRLIDLSRSYFARLLRVGEGDKPKIYIQVFQSAEIADLNYWLEVTFSIGIATLGLIINSPAVVIGAMLISPLMGPIIAGGFAIELGDFYLGFKSISNTLLSIVVSIGLAAIITWVLPFRTPAEAAKALGVIASNYEHHCLAARAYAEKHFDAARVCAELLG